jgi:hypothetical protein
MVGVYPNFAPATNYLTPFQNYLSPASGGDGLIGQRYGNDSPETGIIPQRSKEGVDPLWAY